MVSDVSSGVPGTARQVNDDLGGDTLSSLALAPDGNTVAYARISGGVSTVEVVDVTDALPASPQPTNLVGPTTGLLTAFHTDSERLIALGDFETVEQLELYSIDLSGNQPADAVKLNHNLGSAEKVGSAQLSPLSDRVIYSTGEATMTELFVVDLDGTGRAKVDHGLGNGQSLVPVGFAREAETYLYRVNDGTNDVEAYTIDLSAGPAEATLAFATGGAAISWCGLAADGSLVACASNGGIYLGDDFSSPPVAASTNLFFLD